MGRPEREDDDSPVPTGRYLRLLQEYCERLGIRPEDVGFSRQTAHRLFKTDRPTLSAANKFAEAVRKKGGKMPPAHVAILDEVDYEWITMGRELREAAEERFSDVVEILRLYVNAARESSQAMSRLKQLVGTPTPLHGIVPPDRDEK